MKKKTTKLNEKLNKLLVDIFESYLRSMFHKDHVNFKQLMAELNKYSSISECSYAKHVQHFFTNTNVFNRIRAELIQTNEEEKTMKFRAHLFIILINKFALCKAGKPKADFTKVESPPTGKVAEIIANIITCYEE